MPVLIIVACTSHAVAEDRDKLRDARAVAESMVTASGPVRAAAWQAYTPPAWRASRNLAGTYRDADARHRFTRHTYGWHAWYGCWSHCGPGWRAWGPYRCW